MADRLLTNSSKDDLGSFSDRVTPADSSPKGKKPQATNFIEKQKPMNNDKKVQKDKDGNFFVVEPLEMSEMGSEVDPYDGNNDIDDIEGIKASAEDLQNLDQLISDVKGKDEAAELRKSMAKPDPKVVKRESVVEDFIRNFLIKYQMNNTLECFQSEWYDLVRKGKITGSDMGPIPDVYFKNEKLEEKVQNLIAEVHNYKLAADKAKDISEKLRKERDFHKMHHSRVQQEKKVLLHDLEKLRGVYRHFEESYRELSHKYEALMKERMLLKLERDRVAAKSESLQKTVSNLEEKFLRSPDLNMAKSLDRLPPQLSQSSTLPELEKITFKSPQNLKTTKFTPIPSEDRPNPYAALNLEVYNSKTAPTAKNFKSAHMMTISSIAMHPKKSILATASDDMSWKIWTVPKGELIMSGEGGHKDWISGIDFHPKGLHLATSSGDSTIKIWDFVNKGAIHTFKDHVQPVWNIKFHDTGDFLVSASMDHTCKIFDLAVGKARQTLRGHVDSVNHIMFQPFTNTFASASADKTVSMWDIRTALCCQTFYGHLNSANHVAFSLKGDSLASCDSDGVVKVWDIRMIKERKSFNAGNYSVNSCAWDKSGTILAAGSDDGSVKLFNDKTGETDQSLKGHEDAVQDVVFDYHSRLMISSGSDGSFVVWS